MPNWQYIPPMGVGQQGAPVQNANGGTPLVGARSIADARRMMQTGRAPQAQYPDGYLGTLIDRRGDRVMVAVQGRLTQRQYQRGVHKGERIDLRDYFWPEWLNPDSGIQNEATGRRWTPRGAAPVHLAHLGKTPVLDATEIWKTNPGKLDLPATGGIAPGPNQKRVAQLGHMRPPWS